MMSAGRNCAGDVSMNTHVWHEQQRPPTANGNNSSDSMDAKT